MNDSTKDKNKDKNGPGVHNYLSHITLPKPYLGNSVILGTHLSLKISSEVEYTNEFLDSVEHT